MQFLFKLGRLYSFFLFVSILGYSKDLSFHYSRTYNGCVNQEGELGFNIGHIGECGLLNGHSFYQQSLANHSFRGAKLENASFGGADLRNVDFIGADLTGANLFQGAQLQGAKFSKDTILPIPFEFAEQLGMIFIDFTEIDKRLCIEADRGNLNEIERLIDSLGDANALCYESTTPIAIALYENHLDAAKLLLAVGADINAQSHSKNETILMRLIGAGLVTNETVAFMMDNGANPSIPSDYCRSPYTEVVTYNPRGLSKDERVEKVFQRMEILLSKNHDLNFSWFNQGKKCAVATEHPILSYWMSNISNYTVDRLRYRIPKLFFAKGADPNQKIRIDGVEKHLVTAYLDLNSNESRFYRRDPDPQVIQDLVGAGADLRVRTYAGTNIFWHLYSFSCAHNFNNRYRWPTGCDEVATLLFQNGVDIREKNTNDFFPAHSLIDMVPDEWMEVFLTFEPLLDSPEVLSYYWKYDFDEEKKWVRRRRYGFTGLKLISAGAGLYQTNPKHHPIYSCNRHCIDSYLQHGIDLNYSYPDGTHLLAHYFSNRSIIELDSFRELGADFFYTDLKGNNFIDYVLFSSRNHESKKYWADKMAEWGVEHPLLNVKSIHCPKVDLYIDLNNNEIISDNERYLGKYPYASVFIGGKNIANLKNIKSEIIWGETWNGEEKEFNLYYSVNLNWKELIRFSSQDNFQTLYGQLNLRHNWNNNGNFDGSKFSCSLSNERLPIENNGLLILCPGKEKERDYIFNFDSSLTIGSAHIIGDRYSAKIYLGEMSRMSTAADEKVTWKIKSSSTDTRYLHTLKQSLAEFLSGESIINMEINRMEFTDDFPYECHLWPHSVNSNGT